MICYSHHSHHVTGPHVSPTHAGIRKHAHTYTNMNAIWLTTPITPIKPAHVSNPCWYTQACVHIHIHECDMIYYSHQAHSPTRESSLCGFTQARMHTQTRYVLSLPSSPQSHTWVQPMREHRSTHACTRYNLPLLQSIQSHIWVKPLRVVLRKYGTKAFTYSLMRAQKHSRLHARTHACTALHAHIRASTTSCPANWSYKPMFYC